MTASDIKVFGIIGGDKRQLFLAKSLCESGKAALLGGFDRLQSTGSLVLTDIKTAIFESDAVIFPLPSVRADKSVNTPFSDITVFLREEEQTCLLKKPMFVAMREKFLRAYPRLGDGRVFDYFAKEEFAVMNALPTAEGAVECAMQNFEGTISGSKCLVTGFGRIGKLLSKTLKALNAEVTVTARKPIDLAYIGALGFEPLPASKLDCLRGYDLVFNTVPALIFDRDLLRNTDRDTIIIDLASLPGGVDFEAARSFEIDAVRALSLPGKCAPKTAGEIIKKTVFNIMEEVYR